MANPLAKVILGNMANGKKAAPDQSVKKSWTQHLSPTEEQSLLSVIHENNKVETKKGVINQPHRPNMVTLAQLSGKKPEKEMLVESRMIQEQEKKEDNRIEALLSQINQNKKVETKKGIVSAPHEQTLKTLAGLSKKDVGTDMIKPRTVQQQGKEVDNGFRKVSLGEMGKGLHMTAKKRR